ncbi:hypothetical protein CPSG_01946 [Coccidioides posadasii str. Silveira]|uniref:Uncharacterized protein n=1 Tax=Coccidioides posadasii (strain RMSCC 757 / Silveira) TaxID=443226 RepID=E9CWW3_COCPS|nr:hypothetical protein CPSG_01946 [Coccidioides posadasii str. Silveira]
MVYANWLQSLYASVCVPIYSHSTKIMNCSFEFSKFLVHPLLHTSKFLVHPLLHTLQFLVHLLLHTLQFLFDFLESTVHTPILIIHMALKPTVDHFNTFFNGLEPFVHVIALQDELLPDSLLLKFFVVLGSIYDNSKALVNIILSRPIRLSLFGGSRKIPKKGA